MTRSMLLMTVSRLVMNNSRVLMTMRWLLTMCRVLRTVPFVLGASFCQLFAFILMGRPILLLTLLRAIRLS
jgi:hypothetical protein